MTLNIAGSIKKNVRTWKVACLVSIGALVPLGAQAASDWPTKTITIVVPFPPGGATDQLGRITAQHLSESLGQSVIVENRPGAGGMIGSQAVARAAPDGYTILVGSVANVLNQLIYKKPSLDIQRDLDAVSQLIQLPNYVATNPKSG